MVRTPHSEPRRPSPGSLPLSLFLTPVLVSPGESGLFTLDFYETTSPLVVDPDSGLFGGTRRPPSPSTVTRDPSPVFSENLRPTTDLRQTVGRDIQGP